MDLHIALETANTPNMFMIVVYDLLNVSNMKHISAYFGPIRLVTIITSLPATMDSTTLKYLRAMERVGYFDNAIVFFLSDHGKLFHPLDKLPEAFLEDRLPTFFISIPEWFHYTHPELIKNLETNCQRLTSPYDIYMTMQHLLKINEPNFDIKAATGCTRCRGLFREIPENRTCLEAATHVTITQLPANIIRPQHDDGRMDQRIMDDYIERVRKLLSTKIKCNYMIDKIREDNREG
uniref:Uncharacterized protein n=1 Tax=Glossina austeni TaxID=7395 RepID=A0A1A9V8U7_GLOAU